MPVRILHVVLELQEAVNVFGFCRETEPIGTEREREREIDFKKLAHTIMEAGKFKIYRKSWQVGNPGKSYSLNLKVSWLNPLFLWVGQSFFL